MIGILEAGRKAFEQYKKDIFAGVLYGFAWILLMMLFPMPILGAFIWAYLTPRLLNWYYNKTIGNMKTDYNLTFKVWLVFGLIIHIIPLLVGSLLVLRYLSYLSTLTQMKPISIDEMFVILGEMSRFYEVLLLSLFVALGILIFIVLYTYTLCASVLGKINRIEIKPMKSLYLMVYIIFWFILLEIAFLILFKISAVILKLTSLLGDFSLIIYLLFGSFLTVAYYSFVPPFISLIAANFILSS